ARGATAGGRLAARLVGAALHRHASPPRFIATLRRRGDMDCLDSRAIDTRIRQFSFALAAA
ncbi:hypothetical protein, partial [Burkholderia sp. Ap-962]|uniref:hypothetical protein n=1 Tax=Burkholderia sp. Ap-962 TaxID=2608333 RepID=UPI0019626129